MGDDAEQRATRARDRAHWPGAVRMLKDLPEVELVEGEPGELMAMVTALTLQAWAMRGESLPDYERQTMPGRMIRGGSDS